jgi:curved DNA-binding protein CbpA
MKYHPDKVNEKDKPEATEKFKVISRIHALLSDADKRKLYNDTGKVYIVLNTICPKLIVDILKFHYLILLHYDYMILR